MDELFVDATSMIDAHLQDLDRASSSKPFFNLNKVRASSEDRSLGFYYDPSAIAGHAEPSACNPSLQRRFVIGSHLAQYIRERILNDLGFTTSGGISSSKLLSKLLASIHKPAQQTCWAYSSNDPSQWPADEAAFLAPYKIAKIPGFGFRTQKVLRHHLFAEDLAPGTWTDAPEHTHPYDSAHTGVQELQADAQDEEQPLTVELLRGKVTLANLKSWFDTRLGQRLWNLLYARDEEPVTDAPEYPATISVEDSFNSAMADEAEALRNVRTLALSLLTRLEVRDPVARA
jgi:DNA polymerase iota